MGDNKADISLKLLDFIQKSPSCYHVVSNVEKELMEVGFVRLYEENEWELQAGGKYFVIRNDSSVIAFMLPWDAVNNNEVCGFNIVAAHSDSPTFKLKEKPEICVDDKYVKLNVEKYGGMIMSTWLDRPLSVAGRISYKENNEIATKLVNVDKDLLVIPNVAIHMNRDINKGFEYNAQNDMTPLFAAISKEEAKDALIKEISNSCGIEEDRILGMDLFLYVRETGRVVGLNGEFILSPKLDDLQCVFAALQAFKETTALKAINVCAIFDNEEVGSATMQGADSTFLEDVLIRISEKLGDNMECFRRRIARSFLISADNAHAAHPNHLEKADPTNKPYLNEGIVIKYHGGQKYTTDAVSQARMKDICIRARVPYQTYANRSDIAGGSTLGNISTGHVSVRSVDIGMPQLAMHSAVETGGSKDTAYAIEAFKVFFAE